MTWDHFQVKTEPVETQQASNYFQAYSVHGIVSSNGQVWCQPCGDSVNIYTSAHRCFQSYDIKNLRNTSTSILFEYDPTHIAFSEDRVYACCQNLLYVFNGKAFLSCLSFSEPIVHVMAFYPNLFIFCTNFLVYLKQDRDQFTEADFLTFEGPITGVCHPYTYINKVLISFEDCSVILLNLSTKSVLYRFSFPSPVSTMASTLYQHHVAFGLESGDICLHNILLDSQAATFRQTGRVIGLSFRYDNHHHFCSTNSSGDLFIWDCNNAELLIHKKNLHASAFTPIFLPLKDTLITCGSDNCIRKWQILTPNISENPELVLELQLVTERKGHQFPVLQCDFFLDDGSILSLSQNNLSISNIWNPTVWREISKTHKGKLSVNGKTEGFSETQERLIATTENKVSGYSYSTMRLGDWPCCVSIHHDSPTAYTWNLDSGRIDSMYFHCQNHISSVYVTDCANYVVFGCVNGSVELFNLQSGIQRYNLKFHESRVVFSAFCTYLGTIVSVSSDGTLVLYQTDNRQISLTHKFPNRVLFGISRLDLNLVCLALEQFKVALFDIRKKCQIRLVSLTASLPISMTLATPKVLLVATVDQKISTVSLLSNTVVDVLDLDFIPKNISYNNDFLLVTSANTNGIYLYVNRAGFHSENRNIRLPLSLIDNNGNTASPPSFLDCTQTCRFGSIHQLIKWNVIKENTKVVLPEKSAPPPSFLLGSAEMIEKNRKTLNRIPSIDEAVRHSHDNNDTSSTPVGLFPTNKGPKALQNPVQDFNFSIKKLFQEYITEKQLEWTINQFKAQTASAIHFEIVNLGTPDMFDSHKPFLLFILDSMRTSLCIDFSTTLLFLYLEQHSVLFLHHFKDDKEICEILENILSIQQSLQTSLQDTVLDVRSINKILDEKTAVSYSRNLSRKTHMSNLIHQKAGK